MREEEAEGGDAGEKRFFGLLEPSFGCEKQQEKKGVESTGMDGWDSSESPPLPSSSSSSVCWPLCVAVC
jgi:hypothetical protein